jgi:hypothetical protein
VLKQKHRKEFGRSFGGGFSSKERFNRLYNIAAKRKMSVGAKSPHIGKNVI